MRISFLSRRRAITVGILSSLSLCAQTPPSEGQGIPPRSAPADYQAKAVAGNVTIAADFVAHAVPTPQGPLTTEDFVVVEVAFYGPPEARLKIAAEDFSIRINGKKMPTPSQPYGLALKSLKDPEWVPPSTEEKGSKGGINTGGNQGAPKPDPPKMPFPLRRAMEQRAQKVALPEGDRALPQAGLIFFPYRGKDSSIRNIELIYTGAAGTATLSFEQ
ncbi:hypothetical protein [Bryobacter aggregatus]|uniref:hypothetical protein n=1 Tax=Bryobacter aggregatus TaxID=360054 RepID=UPI0004E1A0AF|nr:hypothetical protein [Bryobacter aggregatus]